MGLTGIASTAGLVGNSAIVWVAPPLFCSPFGPSPAVVLFRSPIWVKRQLAATARVLRNAGDECQLIFAGPAYIAVRKKYLGFGELLFTHTSSTRLGDAAVSVAARTK